MEITLHPAKERGFFDHGWLRSFHSFSFAEYYDSRKMHFGCLRVLNDDLIQGGQGFGTHPHDNMEIVTIVLQGSLKHEDSMGNKIVIKAGEVQRMSAGTGIRHSEFNASMEEVHLLQIWIFPKIKNIEPSYEQKHFFSREFVIGSHLLISPEGTEGSLRINQDAFFTLVTQEKNQSLNFKPRLEKQGVYFFVIEGEIHIAGKLLKICDGIGVTDGQQIPIDFATKATVLAIEVPLTR